jgi:hypothetical protein
MAFLEPIGRRGIREDAQHANDTPAQDHITNLRPLDMPIVQPAHDG